MYLFINLFMRVHQQVEKRLLIDSNLVAKLPLLIGRVIGWQEYPN